MARQWIEKRCACGAVFQTGRRDVVKCEACRYKQKVVYNKFNSSERTRQKKQPKICRECGKEFMEGQAHRKICDACQVETGRARARHYQALRMEQPQPKQERRAGVITSRQLTLPSLAEMERRRLIQEARERGEKVSLEWLDRVTGVVK